ncbi:MAG TPA: tetratricopeptide repeat protein [Terracidiphilus sp.]|nr:tetratricopeptide repeat protein [Terracidiphilus sp.]
MSERTRRSSLLFVFLGLFVCLLPAQEPSKQELDRIYQSAAADYDGGRSARAADELERVLPYAARSYEVHELLGMVYASLGENAKAETELKLAVQLNPNSAAARTNFGTILLHTGKAALAGEQFRRAQQVEPRDYDANHNLAELLLQENKIADALPLLKTAQELRPDSYDNGFDLAMADFETGQLEDARQTAQAIVKTHDTGEVHNLLAQIDEKDGKFVDAANEYEMAAHLDPTEDNLFDWGSEMLLHRTYEPAITIFQQGTGQFPKSPRLLIGLGLALYSRGRYDEAVQALLKAADLNPGDPRCYLFLSKAYDSSPQHADAVIQAFRRYAGLQPNDAHAQYYLAISLWKGNRAEGSTQDLQAVESLLQKSIALDGTIPESHVQLGDLYSGEHAYDKAIPEYVRALALNPNLSDAHYRLGTDYVHIGKKEEAQQEFAIYQKLRAEHLAEADKERAEVQQFVYSEKGNAPGKF